MALWTPALIDTALWLDAADESTLTLDGSDNVEEWADKSGNEHVITQTASADRPTISTINSKNTVLFNGANYLTGNWANIFAGSSGDGAAFYVIKFNQTDVISIPARVDGVSVLLIHGYASASTNFYRISGISDTTSRSLSSEFGTDANIVSLAKQSVNGAVHRNGAVRLTVNNLSTSLVKTGTLYVGVNGSLGGNGIVGHIAEYIVLDYGPSAEYRQKIEGYLAHKWGLEANLPADHPYKTAAPAQTTVSGIITDENGNPVQRKVYAMTRPTDSSAPVLLAHGLSDPTTGAYELALLTEDEVTRIVVAEDSGEPGPSDPVLPDLVDRVIPGS